MNKNQKYKITFYHYLVSGELELIETLTTKPISEKRLKELFYDENKVRFNVCWEIKPRPNYLQKAKS